MNAGYGDLHCLNKRALTKESDSLVFHRHFPENLFNPMKLLINQHYIVGVFSLPNYITQTHSNKPNVHPPTCHIGKH